MNVDLHVMDANRMADPDVGAVAGITWEAWPTPGGSVDAYAARMKAEWAAAPGADDRAVQLALVRVAGRPVAVAKTFAREIHTATGPMVILALAGVACQEAYRGRGFGRAVVEASFDRVRRGEFDLCLFQTTTAVRPFYEKLGCAPVDNPTVNSLNANDPVGRPWWDPEVMIFPGHSPGWPAGAIDLRGPAW